MAYLPCVCFKAWASESTWNDRQMHVIGHQTVAQGLQLMWLDLFPHRSSKNQTLDIGSENELPSISVLRDVMPNIER